MGKCGSWHGQLWFLSKITPSFFLGNEGRVEKSQQGAGVAFEAFLFLNLKRQKIARHRHHSD